jgi:hypothetical protein
MRPVSVGFKTPKQQTEERRPEMATVRVRAKEGRRAFYENRELPIAPAPFKEVNETKEIIRLRDHWGDIEQEGAPPPGEVNPPPEARRSGAPSVERRPPPSPRPRPSNPEDASKE